MYTHTYSTLTDMNASRVKYKKKCCFYVYHEHYSISFSLSSSLCMRISMHNISINEIKDAMKFYSFCGCFFFLINLVLESPRYFSQCRYPCDKSPFTIFRISGLRNRTVIFSWELLGLTQVWGTLFSSLVYAYRRSLVVQTLQGWSSCFVIHMTILSIAYRYSDIGWNVRKCYSHRKDLDCLLFAFIFFVFPFFWKYCYVIYGVDDTRKNVCWFGSCFFRSHLTNHSNQTTIFIFSCIAILLLHHSSYSVFVFT